MVETRGMTEVVEREMEVAGLRTSYREARDGDGPNILYVHGAVSYTHLTLPTILRV